MAEGLVAPEVPTGLAGVEAFTRGFSLVAAINQRNRELQLEQARIVEEDKIKQEQFKYNYAKLQQDQPEIDASTELYKANAELARAHAKAYNDGVATAAQLKQTELKQVGQFINEVNKIPYPKGTQAWQDEYNLIRANPDYINIGGSAEFQRAAYGLERDHVNTANQNAKNQVAIVKPLYDFLDKSKLGLGAFRNPDEEWGTNKKDGKDVSKFLRVDTASGSILPPVIGADEKAGTYHFITVPTTQFNTYKRMADRIQKIAEDRLYAPAPGQMHAPANTSDLHSANWKQAKAVLAKGGDPELVKSLYAKKGFDPSELDMDVAP